MNMKSMDVIRNTLYCAHHRNAQYIIVLARENFHFYTRKKFFFDNYDQLFQKGKNFVWKKI